ncbi:LOW QUALITY PROTEIN: uncharacterized protein LOC129216370 [Uloborus diversus]|uniref:LOW QUALITY PROTEIN: uncharacterized protein LOC129216370 n=1 Tax=Uloborus diversus TaxID=327109 RepID=UPI002409E56A|nr:LOW QUALITY PROTEIN: uncharacterized protein LOC129216370 [Uloborus diversus]
MLRLFFLIGLLLLRTASGVERIGCLPTEFRCSSGQCVDGGRYCDGNPDCFDSSDEPERCTNCNRTYYGLYDVKYPLRLSEHRSPTCSLNFVAAGGRYGERIEITFLSFQIGIFQLDSSTCLRGYLEVEDNGHTSITKRSSRSRRRSKKKGNPRRKGPPLRSPSGSFCGGLIGQSATFYSAGDQVKLTVFVPPQGAAGQPIVPRLYLTYRFLKKYDENGARFLGKSPGNTKCEEVLTDCHLEDCIIRSPNFPGFYLRNLTCFYWIRQETAPPGRLAQIELFQDNEFKINIPTGHTNTDRYKPGTITADCAADVIKVFDGRTVDSPLLAEFCGAGPLPSIRSSGPDFLVQLVSVPSQQLANSHFELSVRVHFVLNSAAFRIPPEGCAVTVDGSRYPVGVLQIPDHSVPAGTICTYRVLTHRPTDYIWLYFASYHVPDLHPWTESEHCDVGKLEIFHPAPKLRHAHHYSHFHHHESSVLSSSEKQNSLTLMETYCEKKSPKQCGHASDYSDLVPSRPCSVPEESYLIPGPELILKMSFLSSTAIRDSGGPNFVARYEVVQSETLQNGIDANSCLVVVRSSDVLSGVLESPKNVFLYGRGGSKDLVCKYELLGSVDQRVRISVDEIYFSSKTLCNTIYEPVVQRHDCKVFDFSKFAIVNVTEIWQESKVSIGCVCDSTARYSLESIGPNVVIDFHIRNMGPKDDFRTYKFRLTFEFVPVSGLCDIETSKEKSVMSGSRGQLKLNAKSAIPFRCRWLLAALPSRALYVTIKGNAYDMSCKNKILFYVLDSRTPYRVFCASDGDNIQSFFTASWKSESSHHFQPDLNIVEFISGEPGSVELSWIEVRRPGPELCPIECPELEACIGEDLACDGVHHCPVTANDESPDRCVQYPMMLIAISAAAVVSLITMIILAVIIKHRLSSDSDKSVIPPPDMYRNDCKQHSTKHPAR